MCLLPFDTDNLSELSQLTALKSWSSIYFFFNCSYAHQMVLKLKNEWQRVPETLHETTKIRIFPLQCV